MKPQRQFVPWLFRKPPILAEKDEEEMTIAAGFTFQKGLLLCADTQHSYPGFMKLHNSKIVSRDLKTDGGGQCVFAISGSVPYAHMAVEHCIREIKKKKPKDRTGAGIRFAIEDAIESFHQHHVYPHPAFHQSGAPDFQLLIAVRSDADKSMAMYATNDSAVTQIDDYECIGSGSFLAHYLIPTLFRHKDMVLDDVTNIAIHVLRETKDYVESCGGGSVFIALHDNGEISPATSWDISSQEYFSRGFRAALQRLYVVAANLKTTPEELEEELQGIKIILEATRHKQKTDKAKMDKLTEALRTVQQATFKRSISQK